MALEVTVGIDIGTTSVKALAVDGDGRVVADSRVGHELLASHAGRARPSGRRRLARRRARRARRAAGRPRPDRSELDIRAIDVAAMVPSLCAVDGDGRPISPGLLYGDERGAGRRRHPVRRRDSGELVGSSSGWCEHHPDAAGFWPAQAVANAALSGVGAIDTMVAFTTMPLFDLQRVGRGGRRRRRRRRRGPPARDRLRVRPGGSGRRGRWAPCSAVGTIDALGEQLVAGADADGDVLVIVGSTLIVWAVVPEWREVDGLWSVPHTAPGKVADRRAVQRRRPVRELGGPSGSAPTCGSGVPVPDDPARVPVWLPYLRGERVPFHDPDRRASLHDLDIGMDAAGRGAGRPRGVGLRRAPPARPRRTSPPPASWPPAAGSATRPGCRPWPTAPACRSTWWPCPEGGALGAAWMARQTAGLEPPGAQPSGWVRTDHRVDPDPRWVPATTERYHRFRELAG